MEYPKIARKQGVKIHSPMNHGRGIGPTLRSSALMGVSSSTMIVYEFVIVFASWFSVPGDNGEEMASGRVVW